MNTPSHVILNLALLLNLAQSPMALPAVALGAILPDLPLFTLYGWAKIQRIPARQLWRETYYLKFWQTWIDLFHSIPLALIGVGLGVVMHSTALQLLFGSAIAHSLLDLPVHNDDAHRHFLPFHPFRWISPLSYWDPRHHGYVVALIEIFLVLMATVYVFPWLESLLVRSLLVLVNLFYLTGYAIMTAKRRYQPCSVNPACNVATAHHEVKQT